MNFKVFIEIAIRSLLEVIFFGGIYFFLNSLRNHIKIDYYLFNILFVVLSTFSIVAEVFLSYIKKIFIDNKSIPPYIVQNSNDLNRYEKHVWTKLTMWCLLFSIPAIAITSYFIHFSKLNENLFELRFLIVMFVVIVTVSSLVFHVSHHKMIAYYGEKFNEGSTPIDNQQSDWYLLVSYFIPWGIIAIMSSALLTYGYYQGKALNFDLHALAFECGGTAWIVTLWISLISEKRSYIDNSANLLKFNDKDNIDESSMYFLISMFSAIVVGAFYLLSHFISYNVTSINILCIVNAFIAFIASITGNLIGILRGFDKYKNA
ncbi:MAG: hypothetical protein CENE_03164 [Candidatus Celerinatantimonas neptuna]|nr:MAG: hypothetical protein CENE_03164 [Candidatus Celerinatantimonas neptuna]